MSIMHRIGSFLLYSRSQSAQVLLALLLPTMLFPALIVFVWPLYTAVFSLLVLVHGVKAGCYTFLDVAGVLLVLYACVDMLPILSSTLLLLLLLMHGSCLAFLPGTWILRRMEDQSRMLGCYALLGLCSLLGLYLLDITGLLPFDSLAGKVIAGFRDNIVSGLPGTDAGGRITPINKMFSEFQSMQNAGVLGTFIYSTQVWRSLFFIIVVILFARWWQSRLFNPGGFGMEFRLIKLHLWTIWTLTVLLCCAFFVPQKLAIVLQAAVLVCFTPHLFSGLACIHRIARRQQTPLSYMVLLYMALIMMLPVMGPMVGFLGIVSTLCSAVLDRRNRNKN